MIDTMTPEIRLILGILVLTVLGASVGTATSDGIEMQPKRYSHRIHRSHTFHVEPRASMDSVLSHVRRQAIGWNEGESLVDIDLSSARLNDEAAITFMEGVLSALNSSLNEAAGSRNELVVPLVIKVTLEMNKITSSGASRLLELLIDNSSFKGQIVLNETTGMAPEDNMVNNHVAGPIKEGHASVPAILEDADEPGTSMTLFEDTACTERRANADAGMKMPPHLVDELDLSFNDIGGHGTRSLDFKLLENTRRLFEGCRNAPRILSLENCCLGPAFCRSIGRGILNAFERKVFLNSLTYRPSLLHLGGNSAIGDGGAVALAAALRMAVVNDIYSPLILEELDLSSCGLGDVGAEALALALASNPGCLGKLDLSNNKITNAGSKALGRALVDGIRTSGAVVEKIILDNNAGIGDDGAAALAKAFECGAVKSISLRSCSVQARGASAFGRAIVSLASSEKVDRSGHFDIELSGNHFGTRKIRKEKGAMYSASLIRDKASSNIKFIGKTLKGAAKRLGSDTMGLTCESDDDEEVMSGLIDDEEEIIVNRKACGGHAFANEILNVRQHLSTQTKESASKQRITVGLRQCCLDDGAIDALSASIIGMKNCELSLDVSMNSAEDSIVEDMIAAKRDSTLLASKAQRHLDFLDRIADARHRQADAAELLAMDSDTMFEDGGVYDVDFG